MEQPEQTLPQNLKEARDSVPAGRWGLALSGGADSVALFHLMQQRAEIQLTAIHLDHETRQGESKTDAVFVSDLCTRQQVPLELARRSDIEPAITDLPANIQARYRALRLELFRRAVVKYQLSGVLQAHHADDQAETIFMRLMRGSGIDGLAGIPRENRVANLRIFRPLLNVPRNDLRQFLVQQQASWREDSSNASMKYQRNRVRRFLSTRPDVIQALLRVQRAFAGLSDTLDAVAPNWGNDLPIKTARNLPMLVQLHAIRNWLVACGVNADDLSLQHLDRVRLMIEDMATSHAISLPGGVEIRRQSGRLRPFLLQSVRSPVPEEDSAG